MPDHVLFHLAEDWPLAIPPALLLFLIAGNLRHRWRVRRRERLDDWQKRAIIDGQERRGFDVLPPTPEVKQ